MDEAAPARMNLVPCKFCGRTFRDEIISKHVPICQKMAKKKRKVFDSGKQRAQGSDIPYTHTIKPGQAPKPEPAKYQKAHEATKNNWKYKHEQLVQGMRAARGAPVPSGGGGMGAPPPTMNPGMDPCRYCGRTFKSDRVEKHEQICGEQTKRAQKDVANRGRGGPAARGGTRGGMAARGVAPTGQIPTRSSGGSQLAAKSQPPPSSASRRPQGQAASPATATRPGAQQGSLGSRGNMSRGNGGIVASPANQRGSPSSQQRPTPNNMQANASPNNRNSGQYANLSNTSSGSGGASGAKFCGGCGTKFSGTTAKFCYECGAPRER